MQKLASKYGIAAHLALLTVAPLFLFPFVSVDTVATVLLWLSLLGAIWVVMGPSRRVDETAHEARLRVFHSCLRDPLFWFSLLFMVLAGVRWLNSGVDAVYDAEREVWTMADAHFPMLPGSVAGIGMLPFAASVALVVLFAGLRHAVGRQARMSFALVASVLSGIAALVCVLSVSFGVPATRALLSVVSFRPESLGTAFGLYFLCSLVAHFGCVEFRWIRAELLSVVAFAANGVALVTFAPVLTVLAFLVAFFLMAVISFIMMRKTLVGTGSFRCALAALTVLVVMGLFALFAPPIFATGAKVESVMAMKVVPDNLLVFRSVLSDIAFRAWKTMPWTGSGLGAFPIDLRFFASAADWKTLGAGVTMIPNGWWQLLVERGVVGALTFLIAFALLFWTYFRRLVLSFSSIPWHPLQILGPIAMLTLVGLTFVDCSFLRADVLLAVCGFVALSASDIPERKRSRDAKMTEDGNGR